MAYEHIPPSEYENIMEKMPVCCVDIVIKKLDRFLLVLRENEPLKGEWWIPGGRIHKNEKSEDAARRKVKEECNINIKIEKKIGFYDVFSDKGIFDNLKTGVHTVSVVFLASVDGEEGIALDKQSSKFRWMTKEEMSDNIGKTLSELRVFG